MNQFDAFQCRAVGCNSQVHLRNDCIPLNYCKKHYDDINSITICTVHNCRNMVVPGYIKCTRCFVTYSAANKCK